MEPSQRMMELIVGSWAAQAVYAAVALGIPERLGPDGAGSQRLAEETGCAEPAVRRLMDYLTALEICSGDAATGYRLTAFGEVLRPEVPGSVSAYAHLAGEEFHPVWGQILHTLRTGGPAFAQVHGQDLYAYLGSNPQAGQRFDAAMNVGHVLFEHIPQVYDFSAAAEVVDIGGGNGELLTAVLTRHPAVRGVLYEDPSTVENARRYLDEHQVGERCETVGGNMFDSVPAGADVYLLSRVLVNWNDAESARILAGCAAAMKDDSVLLIVERPQPEGAPSPIASAVDMLMMLVTSGGRSRPLHGFEALLGSAGLALRDDLELPRGFRLLVAGRA
ncbi:methyltransferase [Kitasatospora sp. NBC_00315]|uniref:methyltransferase n=1 Tax=Kitasatospora sp. NBC_00315 TaxID=2975963 RepID=UPI003255A5CF